MYAGLSFKKQYLLQITDTTLKMFGDTRVKAACNRTGCVFAVRNRVLTRKLRGIQAMRFCIFEIQGPSEVDVEKCNRIIEASFPDYKQRKDYSEKDVAVRLKVGQWTPDNTNLYFVSQRYGLGKSNMGDLQARGPEEGDGAVRQGNSIMDALTRSLRQDWSPEVGGLLQQQQQQQQQQLRRRAMSQGPHHPNTSARGASFTDDEATAMSEISGGGGGGGRYMGFREREAILKNEIERLGSYFNDLQLI